MNKIIRKMNLMVVFFALILMFNMFFEYDYFTKIISNNVRTQTVLQSDYIESILESRITKRSQVILDAASFISSNSDDVARLDYLTRLLKDNDSFASIYFGTPENKMLNGSGWTPPETFDLRVRPWYIKASGGHDLIITEAFLNASKDKMIVTIAYPVKDNGGNFIGVVAGDLSINAMLKIVSDQKITENGFTFLVDSKGNILANQGFSYDPTNDLVSIDSWIPGLKEKLFINNEGLIPTTIDEKEGYLAYKNINNTDMVVCSFISRGDYNIFEAQFLKIFILALASSLLIYVLLFLLQKKYVIEPILQLDQDVKSIPGEDFIDYHLPIIHDDPFISLRESINSVLDKTSEYFKDLQSNQAELEVSNNNLDSSLKRIMAVEGELRTQYLRLVKSKEALRLSEEKNKAIINAIPDIIFIIRNDGTFLDCLVSDIKLLYTQKIDFIGKSLFDVLPEHVASGGMDMMKKALETGLLQIFSYELSMGDSIKNFEMRIVKSKEDEVICITRDITDQTKNQKYIEYLSYHDQLTSLYNRRFYEEEQLRLDTSRNYPIALIMLDVNGLKLTNDAFGHVAGDELLKAVADIMVEACRADDIIARIGGDEFIILLPKTTEEDCIRIVDRIYQLTKEKTLKNIMISVSIGWATKDSVNVSMSDIFTKAEEQMYKRKLNESQSMRNETIQIIIKTLNEKNEREKIHLEKVSRICRELGEAMELDYNTIKDLEIAGLMHDIGKVAIDDNIINKPDKLTPEEYETVKSHSESGYQILKSVNAYSSLAEIILYHHERWDGKGYPSGLEKQEIPLESRIIALADAYESMSSDRPYRKALTREEIIDELRSNSGTQFDPNLVELFIDKILDTI